MIEIIPNWHPVFVHFTMALLSVAGALFIVSLLATGWRHRDSALLVAKWNFWLGAVMSLATVTAGWYAYNTVTHDTPSHLAMTTHRNWALATLTVVVILAIWLWLIQRRDELKLNTLFIIPVIIMLGLLGTTAWYGGELVYRHGLGVMSLPKSSGDGHDHDHGDGHAHGTDRPMEEKDAGHHDSIDGKQEHDHSTHQH